MDDIILASTNMDKINSVKAFLDSKFKNKDIGNLKFFLRLQGVESHLEKICF